MTRYLIYKNTLLKFTGLIKTVAVMSCLSVLIGSATPGDRYPVPPITDKTLFYVQRSNNSNTVMYELNLDEKSAGEVDKSKPVDVYWIRYAEQGQRKELNYIERNFGYGVTTEKTAENLYRLSFVASKSKVAEIVVSGTGKGEAVMKIDNKKSILKKVFVQVKEDSWWPKIAFVEFFGLEFQTQDPVYEKMIINQ